MVSTPFVVFLGMGTVFAGLIVIILLCKLMSFFVKLTEGKNVENTTAPVATPAQPNTTTTIQNKQPILAAISAVVAEELGTEISNIRIHSIKRI